MRTAGPFGRTDDHDRWFGQLTEWFLITQLTSAPGLAGNLDDLAAAGADDREALEVYASLAHSDPDLYEQNYQHLLAELRRTYHLRGDHSTSLSLHLRRDNKGIAQP